MAGTANVIQFLTIPDPFTKTLVIVVLDTEGLHLDTDTFTEKNFGIR